MFNPHHRRALKNSYGALASLGRMITDFDDDPSNTSEEMHNKITDAYQLVTQVQLELDERRKAEDKERAEQRIAMKKAKVIDLG